jgi:hypothetical protein
MTGPKVSDYLLERLRAWDVEMVRNSSRTTTARKDLTLPTAGITERSGAEMARYSCPLPHGSASGQIPPVAAPPHPAGRGLPAGTAAGRKTMLESDPASMMGVTDE